MAATSLDMRVTHYKIHQIGAIQGMATSLSNKIHGLSNMRMKIWPWPRRGL